jgi:hypothetical protein
MSYRCRMKSWSPYATSTSSSSFACTNGNYAGDDNYWYIGYTPCYRANAAFSLYGVLHEEVTDSTRRLKRKNNCNKLTYINSFFTTYGAETISTAFGMTEETGLATATCTSNGNNDGGNNNNANNNAVSATMGCDAGQFTYDTFQGKYCDGNKYLSTEDTLKMFNSNMNSLQCSQIWDYHDSVGERRNLGYGSLAETILASSKVCSTEHYPGVCPDPFGIKSGYIADPYKAAAEAQMARVPPNMGAASWFMFLTGIVLILLSLANVIRKKQKQAKFVDLNGNHHIEQGHGSKLSRVASSMSESARSALSRLTANGSDVDKDYLEQNSAFSPHDLDKRDRSSPAPMSSSAPMSSPAASKGSIKRKGLLSKLTCGLSRSSRKSGRNSPDEEMRDVPNMIHTVKLTRPEHEIIQPDPTSESEEMIQPETKSSSFDTSESQVANYSSGRHGMV